MSENLPTPEKAREMILQRNIDEMQRIRDSIHEQNRQLIHGNVKDFKIKIPGCLCGEVVANEMRIKGWVVKRVSAMRSGDAHYEITLPIL